MKTYNTDKSKKLYEINKKYLTNGVASTLHKSPYEEYPIFIDHAKGSRLYDVDGNMYVDYMGGFGPMILGYANEELNNAVAKQLELGSHYAAPTASLTKLCETLVDIIPCAERVSFESTGTEADMHAVQTARAYTGKEKVIKFEGHYHGWGEELRVSCSADSESALGPRKHPWRVLHSMGQRRAASDNVIILPWNDLELVKETIRREGNDIAAIITEPFICNSELTLPKPGFLEGLREITEKNDMLLIFDEVITGFRIARGGAQEYFGVVPDLATYAKAIAGGFPMSCIAGRAEIMDANLNASGTFNGNPISVAAALNTLEQLGRPGVYENMNRITEMIVNGTYEIANKYGHKIYCKNVGSIWLLQFGSGMPLSDLRDSYPMVDKQAYQFVYKECLARGVRMHPLRGRSYVSTAHTEEDVKYTLDVFDEVFKMLKEKQN